MANLTVPGNSILTMPLPDTKAAPEKFRGRYNKIKSYLTHYELLLEQNNVLGEKDKCELITRYCSRKVTEFIQALPSYSEKKWEQLKADLLKYYDADLDNKKYRVMDLVKMVKGCKEKKMKNLSAWREYGRKFITVGGWLLKKNKISVEEYATYYWNGIPRALRIKLENRLLARDPTRSLSTPFRVEEINEGVEALLQRDRFDMNFAGSDDERDSDEEEEEFDHSSDSAEEDELRRLRRQIRKKAKYSKKKQLVSDSDDSEDDGIHTFRNKPAKDLKRKINEKEEPEIESLIRQLNAMTVDDPGYAALVFRALKLDPDVMKVIRPPVFVSKPTIPHLPAYPRAPQQFQPQSPPHMAPRFSPPRTFGRRPIDDDSCFACEKKGHRMTTCPALQGLEAKKIVARNGMGRYVFTDGRPIKRLPGETLIDAIQNDEISKGRDKLQSHLIRVVEQEDNLGLTNEVYYGNLDSDTSSSEEEYISESCDEILVSAAVINPYMDEKKHTEFKFAYPVTRSERIATEKRREAMEAEYRQPKTRRQAKAKENGVQEGKRTEPRRNDRVSDRVNDRVIAPAIGEQPKGEMPIQMQVPVPIGGQKTKNGERNKKNGREEKGGNQKPVDVRAPEYDGSKDDAIMEDVTNKTGHVRSNKHLPGEAQEKSRNRNGAPAVSQAPEKHTRQSEVAAQVKTVGVLNQVLNTRIDLAIGEVLGISKDLSALLSDKIKLKSSKPPVPMATALPICLSSQSPQHIATSFFAKNRGLLIQLHMQCDGRPITAIIDTGSQLNIVNKSICDSKIIRPVDSKEKISIADANGGQGKLEGMVANVPLNCGEVSTKATLYVGTHVPFELLLGRPWQRGNYVSIDERLNGTYLLFKDPKTLEPRYEILVAVDRAAPEIQYELPVWNVPEAPNDLLSYLIMTDQAPDNSGPTTQILAPVESHLPFSDSETSMILHTPYPSPTIQPTSISIPEGASHTSQQIFDILGNSANSINTRKKPCETLPDPNFSCSQSMPIDSPSDTAGVQSGLSIAPLGSSPLLRLDSEILTTSIADLPFLRRSQSVHPLILSTSDGALLGTLQDPIGHRHIDLVFLNAGLFNLSESPITVTPTAAFVRLFPELGNGPLQPWILPYLNNPPSKVMVSTTSQRINQTIDDANKYTMVLEQFDEKSKKYTLPTEQPPLTSQTPSGGLETVIGDPMPDLSKFPQARSKVFSIPQLAGIPEANDTSSSLAKSVKDEPTDSTCFTNNSLISSNNPEPRDSVLSTPPDTPPHLLRASNESSPTPSSSGTNDDSQDEQTMDMDTDEEMEWNVLKGDISDELAKENEEESARNVEHKRTDSEGGNKENIGITRRRVDEEVYRRLYEAYVTTTGGSPSDEAMDQLQDAYIAMIEKYPQVSPGNILASAATSSNAPIDQPLVDNSIATTATSPRIAKYTPRISSPLASTKPTLFQPPEPPLVFVVQTAPSTDTSEEDANATLPRIPRPIGEARVEADVKTPITIISQYNPKSPLADEPMDQDKKAATDLVPTRPSSPVIIRENRFQRIRKVGRERIIASLEAEIELLHKEVQNPTTEDPNIIQIYEQRLRETIQRLDEMTNEGVGEIDPFKTFVAGLMYILNLAEVMQNSPLPLQLDSPPLAPVNDPLATTEETRGSEIKNPNLDPEELKPTEPIEIVYNQYDKTIVPQCPSQPAVKSDPRSIDIAVRPYFTGGACDFVKRAAGVQNNLIIDTRSLTIVDDSNHLPPSAVRHFTELSGALSSYIFPGRLVPTYDWPLDVAETKAKTFQERIRELRVARREVETMYQKVGRGLSRSHVTESLRPHITLYKRITPGSSQLTAIKMDRMYFWQRIHPVWNPLLKPIEATFLRGVIYALYGDGQIETAERIEAILRTPHYDDWEVRELVALGALDSEFREDEALAYFKALDDEHWAFHAQEEAFRKSANDMLIDMETGSDADNESETLVEPSSETATDGRSMCRTECAKFPGLF